MEEPAKWPAYRNALVIVDMQRDFCEGGSLAVPGAADLGWRLADYIRANLHRQTYIVATKDYHLSGDTNGGHFAKEPDYVHTWPEHCVQGTDGAAFHPGLTELAFLKFDAVFYKGQGRPDYSGFQGRTPTLYDDYLYLNEWLAARKVERLTVVGIATDYCVKATALDAVELGYQVRIPQLLTVAVGGNEARDETIRQVLRAQGLDDTHLW